MKESAKPKGASLIFPSMQCDHNITLKVVAESNMLESPDVERKMKLAPFGPALSTNKEATFVTKNFRTGKTTTISKPIIEI